ncbi:MAG: hypothetical protein NT099_03525 [Candidatus Saganbacteria bacterium]|nr:hypothetical protein [Candidatus Saganbacteria bacterium]
MPTTINPLELMQERVYTFDMNKAKDMYNLYTLIQKRPALKDKVEEAYRNSQDGIIKIIAR